MKSRKFYLFAAVFFGLTAAHGLLKAQTPTPEPVPIAAQTEILPTEAKEISETNPNLVHYGDLIDVDVIGSVEYDWRGTLNPEGFLDGIDYGENPIYALCRSEQELGTEVSKIYAKILRDPQVVVKIIDRTNRPLSMLYGAVKNPQRFQIKRTFFLNELLIVAGGLTERASGEIQILRQKNLNCRQSTIENSTAAVGDVNSPEKYLKASQTSESNYINVRVNDLLSGKKESNPQILSGDVITVLEAESIYVIGGVADPKQISSRTQTTLSRAVAGVGGVSKSGDASKITIYRRESGATKIIEADLEKIKTGAAEDVILRAFDVVEVAQTGREKRKFPPVLRVGETVQRKTSNLPLRVID